MLDEDEELDAYDSRVGGVAATRDPRAECLGETCQPAVQAPNDPTPASAAFRGAGNVRPPATKRCPKGKRRVRHKGHVRCLPAKKRHATPKRRANR